MNKIPMRRCIVTGESLPKKELLRIVKTPEGELKVDPTGKLNGKGAYIKKDSSIIELLKKNNTLERIFGLKVSDSIYEEIKRMF